MDYVLKHKAESIEILPLEANHVEALFELMHQDADLTLNPANRMDLFFELDIPETFFWPPNIGRATLG